ncbi:hypothetical protein L9F63_015902 [Diploptera punctata]|uniref:Uncharacterized protein n=1 Tax=Diploptera punctata TaxID=6984 RepID=A0AAD8A5Q1_DIPPU|nr:hypothetical protein L9F63_015902 [Diploptera punctata]
MTSRGESEREVCMIARTPERESVARQSLSGGRSMKLLSWQLLVVVASVAAMGPTDVPAPAVGSLSYLCSYESCQCSVDLRELSCRGVGFTRVPAPLPASLVKL